MVRPGSDDRMQRLEHRKQIVGAVDRSNRQRAGGRQAGGEAFPSLRFGRNPRCEGAVGLTEKQRVVSGVKTEQDVEVAVLIGVKRGEGEQLLPGKPGEWVGGLESRVAAHGDKSTVTGISIHRGEAVQEAHWGAVGSADPRKVDGGTETKLR